VEGCCEHGNELSSSIKFWKVLSSCITGGFLRRAHLHRLSWLGVKDEVVLFWILFVPVISV
jgi:hypothetical protein